MSVSYKKLWKLLIDKDMKKIICVKRRVSAQRQLPRWGGMGMSPRRYSRRFARHWIAG